MSRVHTTGYKLPEVEHHQLDISFAVLNQFSSWVGTSTDRRWQLEQTVSSWPPQSRQR